MLGFSHGGVAPCGWSVTCTGRRTAQIRDEVTALQQWAARAWEGHFPRERGYVIAIDRASPDTDAVRLSATRGDFSAEIAIEHAVDPPSLTGSKAVRVRLFGRATSSALQVAERVATRRIARGRVVGAGIGLLMFGALCWFAIGVADPIFVLGGLLMVVALVVTTFVGASAGAFIGERFADTTRLRALRSVERDPGLQADLKRWKALGRQLMAQRASFIGLGNEQPFRREPSALPG